jgi:hypothetical protein
METVGIWDGKKSDPGSGINICFFAGILKVDNENSMILVQGPDPNPDP